MYQSDKLALNDILNEMAQLAITPQGKEAITSQKPSMDCYWIAHSQGLITEMKAILNETGSIPLNPLTSFNKAFDDLIKHAVLTAPQIFSIGSFLEDIDRLKRFMHTKAETAPLVSAYALSMDPVPPLLDKIRETVHGEMVLDTASGALGKIRKNIRFTEDKIKSKLQSILQQAGSDAMLTDGLIAMRDGRYVIPVKAHAKNKIAGRTVDASKSGSTAFIEPEAIKRLSDELATYKIAEEDEIYRILSDLTGQIAEYERHLALNREGLITYDQLSAKAKFAQRYQAVAVSVQYGSGINLIEARHPQLGKDAIPLNLSLDYASSSGQAPYRSIVITGPNTGGKTVVLKTVGLLTLMGMCGLLVPAHPSSTLSVFEHVLCDIGDGQSITQNLSTFSSHIVNINSIVDTANPRSLVLLDEVGSGTEPNEGAGIAMAILEALHQKGSMILATTHYSQLKAFAQNTPGFINGSMLFDAQSLSPLYRISVGEAGKSHALLIALKLGMNSSLLNRAHQITYGTAFDQAAYQALATLKTEADIAQDNLTGPLSDSHQSAPTSTKAIGQELGPKTTGQNISPFKEGDSVYIPFLKTGGIVLSSANRKGDHNVEIKGKRMVINYKRLKPFIDSKDLYPDNYDLDIVTKSVYERKTEKALSKGKEVVLVHSSPSGAGRVPSKAVQKARPKAAPKARPQAEKLSKLR